MPRLARKDLNTPFLHVMVQGVNKEYIFEDKKYIKKYLQIIKKNKAEYNFTIMAYCIMNNHAHFLVYAEDIKSFGKFMQKCNLLYAQMYNKEKNRVGVLFRNRYQVEPIYNMKYLVNCIKYIHNNPVKAKMVLKCEDYQYSSYGDYMKNDGVTQSKIMKELFGSKCDYSELFKEAFERRFIDIDNNNIETTKEYIIEGIKEYQRQYKVSISEILSNRPIFKEMIFFLNEECGFRFVEIKNFFEIPKGTMDFLQRR
ncbi:MAG: transposase [Clostridia bacterium]|nr:transposase [Clostridia bacterium]